MDTPALQRVCVMYFLAVSGRAVMQNVIIAEQAGAIDARPARGGDFHAPRDVAAGEVGPGLIDCHPLNG